LGLPHSIWRTVSRPRRNPWRAQSLKAALRRSDDGRPGPRALHERRGDKTGPLRVPDLASAHDIMTASRRVLWISPEHPLPLLSGTRSDSTTSSGDSRSAMRSTLCAFWTGLRTWASSQSSRGRAGGSSSSRCHEGSRSRLERSDPFSHGRHSMCSTPRSRSTLSMFGFTPTSALMGYRPTRLAVGAPPAGSISESKGPRQKCLAYIEVWTETRTAQPPQDGGGCLCQSGRLERRAREGDHESHSPH
jgi:hypothetical protein